MTLRLALAVLAVAACAHPARAQEVAEDPNLGEQDDRVTFGGLVQTQLNTSGQDGADATDLSLRRVRLSANARVSPLVSGRIQAELANAAVGGSAELNEAYALFEFDPAVGVLVGKGGRPFGIIDATTAAALTPIERGARFRGAEAAELYRTLEALAYAGRSVGVQVLGEVGPVVYAAGYFRGAAGEEGGDADIRQFAARVQVQPVAGVKVGLAATSRAFARDDPPRLDPDGSALGDDPSGDTRRGGGVALDVEVGDYGRPGFHALAEVVTGTLDPFRDHAFIGAQGWLAYRVEGLAERTGGVLVAVEPLFRASASDAEGPVGRYDGVLLTPGLNLYAAQNTRLALNLDVFLRGGAEGGEAPLDGDDTLVAFRGQVQIAF
ncbi:porin [Rubrivirga sp. S365]|uniref:porin n=1 Tax=Rubrivirga sp. S365 TaxID=3076080 RepID=UPI0028C86FC7|nr:porin [Rubrivirga sp. S365]MDT7857054.1 porin [Rubrivirga sp. S365]